MRQSFLVAALAGAVLVGGSVGAPAWGETGCEDIPEARRAQCERVMDCIAIEDRDIRRACIAAAQRAAAGPSQGERAPTERARARAEAQQPAAPPDLLEEDLLEEKVEQPAAPRQSVAPAPRQSVAPAPRRQSRPSQPETPEIITGKVTNIFESVLERRLIAIDNGYLFESDQASHARFKVGQTVEARKKRSVFGGRSWLLTGPSGRPVDAFRIRCERDDIGREDRRRCARMLDL